MVLRVIVHAAEEGGFWGEIPAIPGCVSQGDSKEELLQNIKEAAEGCLSIEPEPGTLSKDDQILEIAL